VNRAGEPENSTAFSGIVDRMLDQFETGARQQSGTVSIVGHEHDPRLLVHR
jgi:hypothetical protein